MITLGGTSAASAQAAKETIVSIRLLLFSIIVIIYVCVYIYIYIEREREREREREIHTCIWLLYDYCHIIILV